MYLVGFVILIGGVLAALCSMSSFIPQALKIFRERDASSVSVRMWVIMVAGFALSWIGLTRRRH